MVKLTYNGGSNEIVFNDNIEWLERYLSQNVRQSTRRTVGGGHITYYGDVLSGLPITLRAGEDRGWIPYSDYLILRSLADVPGLGSEDLPGSEMVLYYGTESFPVIFRHEEAPALELRPLLDRVTLDPTDYFVGSIKFLTL